MYVIGRLMMLVHVFAVRYLDSRKSIFGLGTNPIGGSRSAPVRKTKISDNEIKISCSSPSVGDTTVTLLSLSKINYNNM